MNRREQFKQFNPRVRAAVLLCSLGGVGYLPISGTAGSAATLLLLLLPIDNMHLLLMASTVVFTAVGVAAIASIEQIFGDDPSIVVIDEAAGMSLTLASPLIPLEPLWIILGFAFFRLFDIVKPWPVNRIDAGRGPWAVMGDDLVAGVYAALALHAVFHLTALGAMFWPAA